MKYFITDNPKYTYIEGYEIITSKEAPILIDVFTMEKVLAFDIETNGLDPYINKPLLYGFGDLEGNVIIFDHYYSDKDLRVDLFNKIVENDIRVLGQNLKFDIKFAKVNEGILLRFLYDTMITEQRLYLKFGYKNGLEDLCRRYEATEEGEVDKSIRLEFINANVKTFTFQKRHLDYLSTDLTPLFIIKAKQEKKIYEKDMYNLLYKVEFPLISIIAEAELEGFDFNSEEWTKIYEENIEKRFKVECKLDEEFRSLRTQAFFEDKLNKLDLLRCSNGKWDKQRIKSPLLETFNIDGTPKGLDLFGETLSSKQVIGVKKKINFYPNNINFNSDTQVIEMFAHLKEVLLTKGEEYLTPRFNKRNKLDRAYYSFQTNEKALKKRKIDFPKSRMNTFIDLLLTHRKLSTRINTFGISFINKINPITGKLHSEYRQSEAVTGRLQSGGRDDNPDKYNAQNIPRDKRMRNCFIAPKGYKIITSDYTGAELIVMCSLSQDMDLLEMSKRDMHSEIATKCWRAVYEYRAKNYLKQIVEKNSVISQQELKVLYETNLDLSINFIVDKSPEKSHYRTAFKPVTFGVIYGLRAKNLGKYLSISTEEAQIIINILKKTFPKVFAMVEYYSKFAERNGYVIINNRTKSRAYFPNIIKEMQGLISKDTHFREIMEDSNEARNIPIQGTQADFMKEATVRIDNYIRKHNIDAKILGWVHDETITKCKDEEIERHDLEYISFANIKTTGLNFPEVKRLIMNDTANQYLNNVTIDVDYVVEPYWTKE